MTEEQKQEIITAFEKRFGSAYSVREKFFYILLRELWSSRKSHEGWLFFNDTSRGRSQEGFKFYDLSAQVCQLARKKLKRDGLIEYRYVYGAKGHRRGTEYRLIEGWCDNDPKAIHARIMSRIGQKVIPLVEVAI